jgi:Aminotransferase class-V
MLELDSHPSGRHFLQIPGPTNVPDRVLRAIDHPTIDHRGPEFGRLGKTVLAGMKKVFQTEQDVVIYPASGTGAWEAALVNTLSPGDRVLMAETGQFATLWKKLAERLGLVVDFMPGDWRQGANPAEIEKRLRADAGHEIKAVCVVHNETSTGVTTPIAPIRAAIDRAGHPALLLVDTISSLGSIDYRHDEWGVDVTVSGSQKGLMLPPGLSFNAISRKAMEASANAKLPRSYWDWKEMLAANVNGYFPYRPAERLQAPRPLRRSHASRRPRLGPRDPVRESGRIQFCADCGADARGAQRRRLPQDRARALRHVARAGPGQGLRQDLPHRPPWLLQRPDAVRNAGGRRDGPGAGGRAAPQGRRRRGDGLSCRITIGQRGTRRIARIAIPSRATRGSGRAALH